MKTPFRIDMKKENAYALHIYIKSRKAGVRVRSGRHFKGVVIEKSKRDAEKVAKLRFEAIFSDPKYMVEPQDITIKSCELFNDFFINTNT